MRVFRVNAKTTLEIQEQIFVEAESSAKAREMVEQVINTKKYNPYESKILSEKVHVLVESITETDSMGIPL